MNITFVMDLYGDLNNGTTVTCMRTCDVLRSHGHNVKVIGIVPDYVNPAVLNGVEVMKCREIFVPFFHGLIHKEGMRLANASYKDIAAFIKGSDVVHLFLPFRLERKVRRVAKAMSIPVTGAMHMQPESVSSAIGLGHVGFVNSFIYWLLYQWMYRYIRHLHTPSEMMKNQMIQHGYKNEIHAISNGVSSFFQPMNVAKPKELQDKFVILMVGRLAGEKRQDLIIKAIGKSKYNDRIVLVLAGQGPKKKRYQELVKKYLKNPCVFGFYSQDALRDVINYSDLYIHASDAETEAISCIEAFSCGKVPVISDSKISATNHFALNDKCLFKAGNSDDLKDKIDYWIEHPEEKKELELKYVEYSKNFELHHCVRELEKMFEAEIETSKIEKEPYFNSKREQKMIQKIRKKIGLTDKLG